MKRVILSLVAFMVISVSAMAQTEAIKAQPVNPKVVLEKVEKTKVAINHPKKSLKGANWLKHADALYAAYLINIQSIFISADEKAIVTSMGAPTSIEPVKEVGAKKFKLYIYPNVDIYFSEEGKVVFYIEKNIPYANALEEQEVALLKTISLSPKLVETVKPMLEILVNNYLVSMQNLFTYGKFDEAIVYADKAAKLQQHSVLNDKKFLESYYFGVVCAMQAPNYAKAKENLEILVKNNDFRDGEVLYYLGFSEDKLGNVEGAKSIYEDAISKYPNNQDILNSLIDLYVRTDEDPANIIPYIKLAQTKDPNNAVLYIVEGVAYENLKQLDKSILAYEKAVEIDPKSFNAYYNIGYTYSVLADNLVPEFNKIDYTNKTLYDKKLNEINDYRMKAIAPLEKAYELNPTDINAVTLLKSIFFTFRDSSPEMLKKFEKYTAIYKSLNDK